MTQVFGRMPPGRASDGPKGFSGGGVRSRPILVPDGGSFVRLDGASVGSSTALVGELFGGGIRKGDLLISAMSCRGNWDHYYCDLANARWMELVPFRQGNDAGNSANIRMAWKFASDQDVIDSTAGTALGSFGTYDFNYGFCGAVIRNADPAEPFVTISDSYQDGSLTNTLPITLPAWSGDALVLSFLFCNSGDNGNVPGLNAVPAPWVGLNNAGATGTGANGSGQRTQTYCLKYPAIVVRDRAVTIPASAAFTIGNGNADGVVTLAVQGPLLS